MVEHIFTQPCCYGHYQEVEKEIQDMPLWINGVAEKWGKEKNQHSGTPILLYIRVASP